MGLKLMFLLRNVKQIGVNQTFQDSSTRTSVLRRNASKDDSKKVNKKVVDKNMVHHRVQALRKSGGIPKSAH
jgi:hypothetical protein